MICEVWQILQVTVNGAGSNRSISDVVISWNLILKLMNWNIWTVNRSLFLSHWPSCYRIGFIICCVLQLASTRLVQYSNSICCWTEIVRCHQKVHQKSPARYCLCWVNNSGLFRVFVWLVGFYVFLIVFLFWFVGCFFLVGVVVVCGLFGLVWLFVSLPTWHIISQIHLPLILCVVC